MAEESSQLLRVKSANGVAIVSFTTPYLQTEDVIEKVGAEMFALVEKEGYTKVLLSFTGVRFLSSSMLAQMVKLQKKLSKSKGKLRLCALPPATKDVMRASQLDKLIEVFDDETTALAKF
jgi:anti-sigma B factor antagonist